MISMFILQNCHAATKAAEMAGRHMPHMRFFGTNWWDVHIALIICVAIVILISIVSIAASCWHKRKLEAQALKLHEEDELMKMGTTLTEVGTKLLETEAKLTKVEKELKETKEDLEATKMKLEVTGESFTLFKEICTMSKDMDGIVDDTKAEKLFELYQKMSENNSVSEIEHNNSTT